MKFQHLLGLVLAFSFSAPVSAQELRPELPETIGESKIVDEEQKAIDIVTDKVLDPSGQAGSSVQSAPVGKNVKAPAAPKVKALSPVEDSTETGTGKGSVIGGSVGGVGKGAGAVGHGAVKGVESVGRGAANGAEAVGQGAKKGAEAIGHGAEAVGHGAVTGAEAVGRKAVGGVEAVGRGAQTVGNKAVVGVEAVGRGAQTVGTKAVVGIEKLGHGGAEFAETVGEKTKAGAEKVGQGAVKGAETLGRGVENLGRGVKRGLEALSSKIIGDKPAATAAVEQTPALNTPLVVVPQATAPAAVSAPTPGSTDGALDLQQGSNGNEPQADAPAGW